MDSKSSLLLNAALTLFASEGMAVPTARIAKEAGVANGTLFNYFPTKQALVDQLYISLMAEVSGLFETSHDTASVKQTFFMTWQAYTVWAISHPLKHNTLNMLQSANAISVEAARDGDAKFKHLHDAVAAGQQQNEIMPMAPVYLCKVMSAVLDVAIADAVAQKLEGKQLAAHVMTAFSLFWKGIVP